MKDVYESSMKNKTFKIQKTDREKASSLSPKVKIDSELRDYREDRFLYDPGF